MTCECGRNKDDCEPDICWDNGFELLVVAVMLLNWSTETIQYKVLTFYRISKIYRFPSVFRSTCSSMRIFHFQTLNGFVEIAMWNRQGNIYQWGRTTGDGDSIANKANEVLIMGLERLCCFILCRLTLGHTNKITWYRWPAVQVKHGP